MRFAGDGSVSIPRTDALDATSKPWTVEAVVKPEAGDGVILAHGGQSHGYALYLESSLPVFAVRMSGQICAARATQRPPDGWTRLTGLLTDEGVVELYVDGKLAAHEGSGAMVLQNPNEGLEIGSDVGTPVGDYAGDIGFRGLIDEVRIYQGARKPE